METLLFMKNTENFLSQSLEIEGKMEGKNGGYICIVIFGIVSRISPLI